jgi:hypothetical protein
VWAVRYLWDEYGEEVPYYLKVEDDPVVQVDYSYDEAAGEVYLAAYRGSKRAVWLLGEFCYEVTGLRLTPVPILPDADMPG